jgi:hypothetical protein
VVNEDDGNGLWNCGYLAESRGSIDSLGNAILWVLYLEECRGRGRIFEESEELPHRESRCMKTGSPGMGA